MSGGGSERIRVVVVDDETLVRRGIIGLLQLMPDIEVVGEGEDGEHGLAAIERLSPQVVLLDVRMPRRNGIEVLEQLRAKAAATGVILLTTFDDDEALLRGIRAGARGFLMKDVSVETLADAIRQVAAGEKVIRPAITERVRRSVEATAGEFDSLDLPDKLTRREAEILSLLAAGYSNREIGEALEATEGTIKNHVSSVLSKLGVRDRTRAVLRGIELGYL